MGAGEIEVVGGLDVGGKASARVDRFTHGDYWLRAPATALAPRRGRWRELWRRALPRGGYLKRTGLVSINEGFNTRTSKWTRYADLPAPRAHAMAAVARGLIYVFGGTADRQTKVETNAVFAYDPAANRWTTKAPMPVATSGGTATAIGDVIYVSMGDGSGAVYAYDAASDRWRTIPNAPSGARAAAAATSVGKLYLAGGNGFWKFAKSGVSVFDPSVEQWSVGAPLPHAVRFAAAVSTEDGIGVFGGLTGVKTSTAYTQQWDIGTGTWSIRTPMP
ncbi:MAG: kelch repeat-containing protein [Gemmatimonadaceae bacterium]